jgi:hypothetical protein
MNSADARYEAESQR